LKFRQTKPRTPENKATLHHSFIRENASKQAKRRKQRKRKKDAHNHAKTGRTEDRGGTLTAEQDETETG